MAASSKRIYTPVQGSNSAAVLRGFVERVERLEEEKPAISTDIRDVYAEAKGNGFDTKALRVVIKRRKADAAALATLDALVDTYSVSLGMVAPDDEE